MPVRFQAGEPSVLAVTFALRSIMGSPPLASISSAFFRDGSPLSSDTFPASTSVWIPSSNGPSSGESPHVPAVTRAERKNRHAARVATSAWSMTNHRQRLVTPWRISNQRS